MKQFLLDTFGTTNAYFLRQDIKVHIPCYNYDLLFWKIGSIELYDSGNYSEFIEEFRTFCPPFQEIVIDYIVSKTIHNITIKNIYDIVEEHNVLQDELIEFFNIV